MALEPASFLQPVGELNPDWFPDVDLDAFLASWVVQAGSPDDAVVEAFVYCRAFNKMLADLMNQPNQQRDRDKSETWGAGQLDYWAGRANHWCCEYDRLTDPVEPVRGWWDNAGAVR